MDIPLVMEVVEWLLVYPSKLQSLRTDDDILVEVYAKVQEPNERVALSGYLQLMKSEISQIYDCLSYKRPCSLSKTFLFRASS